jgi:hypothetical protein
MSTHDADLEFPSCCACCPHLRRVKASCTHELRQSLVQELTTNQSCPVYSQAKTNAMQQLTEDQ